MELPRTTSARFKNFEESYDDVNPEARRDERKLISIARSLKSSTSEHGNGKSRIHNSEAREDANVPTTEKQYDGTESKDHLKVFQASAQVERWAMPTWCHMFNSTLIGAARVWFDELPPESIDGYKDLKAAFLAYFMQQKKHVKDPVEIHNIKQKDGETIEEFMKRFKVKTGRPSKRPTLRKRLPKPTKGWTGTKQVHPLNRTPKEIFAAESEKFKPPPPMVTPVDKRSSNKFCEFHNDKGHNTDECMQLKKQIEELVKASKLSHFIKEIREDRDKQKNRKKEAPTKEKAAAIYMIQPWHRVLRQKVTLSFAQKNEITFPPLSANKGTEGPLVIEAEIGGHAVHRMYVDGGSSMEILYEHCFNRLRPEIKSQMVPATTSLTGFSGETIWPLGQLRLSPSPYNDISGRHGIREIQAVPSTAHGMLKFPVDGGVVTIRSTILMPNECATITATSKDSMKKIEGSQENVKVAIHHDFPDQEVALGGTLSIEGRTTLCALLKRNLDIFAWQPSDMTGVPRQTAEHRLNIRDGYPPVRQKKRGQAPERAKAIQAEVKKHDTLEDVRRLYESNKPAQRMLPTARARLKVNPSAVILSVAS
ncbi:reverse transcriptase domain-containing protein [Tanacetum coccineum]